MNEWGTPDWHDPSAYGDTEDWTSFRWIWEFTRRREDYRTETMDFLDLFSHYQGLLLQKENDPTPEIRRELQSVEDKTEWAWNAHWKNWGYRRPLDPRVSDQPNELLLRWRHDGVQTMRGSPPEKTENRSTLTPKHNEMGVIINLDRPLPQQLELIKGAAAGAQIMRHDKLLHRRHHRTKWFGYLRTLDAREAGASWAEISQIHPHTRGDEQSARDVWEQARALGFTIY